MPSSRAPAPEGGPVGPGPDDKRLRAAARLAVEVARAGERAEPREPAPAELRPVLGFSRLSAASYRVVHRVIDQDGVFRARVAAAADEAAVGRVGWLWLHRPVGWLDDPALATATDDGADDDAEATAGSDRATAVKHRKAAKEADAARRRAVDEAAEARRELRQLVAEHRALLGRVEELEDARSAAMRSAKEAEAQLAAARRDLKVARRATREAEAELAEHRRPREAAASSSSSTAVAAPEPATVPDATAPSAPVVPATDPALVSGLAGEVASAATAASALADALGRAAERLAAVAPVARSADATWPPSTSPGRPPSAASPRRTRRSTPRALPALPPGVFDGSPEAERHLIGDRSNLLLVDGYNLARSAWPGLAPEEERRRTVALLEEVQARSGGRVVVIFDGDDAVVAPPSSRRIRARYSATGQTADAAIVELLDGLEPEVPVVVVSSDREVVRGARSRGAAPMSSPAFLAAAGR